MSPIRSVTITVKVGENYPQQLKKRLEEYEIKQREICELTGLEESQISRLLNQPSKSSGGPQSPRLDTVVKIEAAIAEILDRRRRVIEKYHTRHKP